LLEVEAKKCFLKEIKIISKHKRNKVVGSLFAEFVLISIIIILLLLFGFWSKDA
jgi:hypothetical protein